MPEGHVAARVIQIGVACATTRDHVDSWTQAVAVAISESVALLQLGSVLRSLTSVTTEGHATT